MKNSNATPLTLIHPAANGSPKPDAGMPVQSMRAHGYITCRTPFSGVQHIRVSDIITFGTAAAVQQDAHGRMVGTPTPELGKCAMVLAGVGQIIVNHSTETVAQLIADFHK